MWSFALPLATNVVTYGVGCPGSNAQVPAIGALGAPRLGTNGFEIEVTGAAQQSAAALLFAGSPAIAPLGRWRTTTPQNGACFAMGRSPNLWFERRREMPMYR